MGNTLLLLLALGALTATVRAIQPHVIYILVDDMGQGDMGHSKVPEIPTPHLTQATQEGIEMRRFYTQPKCTAARAALMTARYPYKLGVATYTVFTNTVNNTLSLKYQIMPQYLKKLNYSTHHVGKWHLGFCHEAYTPIGRGFDSSFGTYNNVPDHFYYGDGSSWDWNFNNEPYFQANGSYSTHLVTNRTKEILANHFANPNPNPLFAYVAYHAPHKPVQAPEKYYKETACKNLKNKEPAEYYAKRMKYCGMVLALDEAYGEIIDTLKHLNQLENSIIVFHTDNGASIDATASSWEYRGGKQTVYEGGTLARTIFRIGKNIQPPGGVPPVYNGLVNSMDMLPTLYEAAGGDLNDLPADLDGHSVWQNILTNTPTERHWVVHNLNSEIQESAVTFKNATHDFKLVYQNKDRVAGWTSVDPRPLAEQEADPIKRSTRYLSPPDRYRLFNMANNPLEYEPQTVQGTVLVPDAAEQNPEMKEFMKQEMLRMVEDEVPTPHYERFPAGKHPGKPSYWADVYGYPAHHPGGCNIDGSIVTEWENLG